MFTFWVKVMDSIILQILWIGYIIYESLRPEKDIERSDTPYESQNLSQDNSKNKRHFIHLYTTTSTSGKPVCYMDVYQMNSKSEELKLRSVCSKGVPNQTYFKHKEQLTPENSYISEEWKNYSIMAI
ncbi:unnamed protein product [Psylliodes chrysocephalus]|uniref:Uncharacterized protein n=1 Tax=Psylliodes chrysocephalus TaxID=3402493 RepID=A0A9P0CRN0_9CUCU|nr:unnamed protein product [Psylliodes chrysocephala]